MQYDFGTGGYDVEIYITSSLYVDQGLIVCSNVSYTPEYTNDRSFVGIYKRTNGYEYIVSSGSVSGGNVLASFTDYYQTGLGMLRVVAHGQHISVYSDNRWVHTFTFEFASLPPTRYVALKTSGSAGISYNHIRSRELCDYREAIFMDMETNSVNAIRSVLLQRPVEMYPTYDGKLSFMYDPARSTNTLLKVKKHASQQKDDNNACSDAIVYFTDVAVVVDRDYLINDGFTTRMYRFPDLAEDAVSAAIIAQERARERQTKHKVVARYDPRVELGDIANANYTRSGTGSSVDKDIIVEAIMFKLGEGEQTMTISGREDV